MKVAQSYYRLLYGTWEPVVSMQREKLKWRHHKSESTEVRHRGGPVRSSEEVTVMVMERRSRITRQYQSVNQKDGRN
jgi:hypothetical protein